MHSDPIADMLTRIRNAQAAKKETVILPYSKIKHNIANILSAEKWLGKVEKIKPALNKKISAKNGASSGRKNIADKNTKFNQLKIGLLYNSNSPHITKLNRVSKPGRRIYVSKNELPIVLNNYGIAIISTSKGLMTNKEARVQGLGGEILCEIY